MEPILLDLARSLPLGRRAHEQVFLRHRVFAVLGRDAVLVLLALHAAGLAGRGDDLLDLRLGRERVVPVRDDPVRNVLGRAQELGEELAGVGPGDLGGDLVLPGLGARLDLLALPPGHQPLDEVVGPLVVGLRELGRVGRVEVGHIRLDARQDLPGVRVVGLAGLLALEYQGVDAPAVLREPLLELARAVSPPLLLLGGPEVPEPALARDAGLPSRPARM